ncbi:DUF202 domain-containing protein [Luteipulveratus mongoliensis]|uniref:DUF202 domain-containing protein n=1 Tax=Luteipulveratus mongoliensis TaxID=571913 RepID=A0A0K1JE71_9MICO|nr:DUF202 domain-containing protein [Luteipulveratus mongoliensis]AKU14885.1 hypothetical protein VV02_01745 [Luteipulveratus mongoliensis]
MTGSGHAIPDRGMQAERTALAWRRTSLSVAVASLGALRVGAVAGAPIALVVGGFGLLWSAALGLSARTRGRDALARMRAAAGTTCADCPPAAPLDGAQGVHIAAAAAGAVICGLGCLAVVLLL